MDRSGGAPGAGARRTDPQIRDCGAGGSLIHRRTWLQAPLLLGSRAIAAAAPKLDLRSIERDRVLRAANRHLNEQPVTVTASSSPRSAGGKHDYFSEGDYWWPDPQNPSGPYIQRDGLSNPDNFVAHREALIRLSVIVPALAAAALLTGKRHYAQRAAAHLRAWFVDPETRMNPHLLYAQAIQGRVTGRGIGIIDTLHLVEVARAIPFLELPAADRAAVRDWFAAYLDWMTTHKYGQDERDAKNNHGTAWVFQVAEFARLTGNEKLCDFCRQRFRTVLLPGQLAADGSFPLELRRTKPYNYSLFNLDLMCGICQSLSSPSHSLWQSKTEAGAGMEQAVAYMAPFIADKSKWPHAKDVQYWEDWPVRHPSLLFAGLAYARPEWIRLWRGLNPDPAVPEVVRNYPVRQPVLWAA